MTLLEEIFKFLDWKNKHRRSPTLGSTEMVNSHGVGGEPTLVMCVFKPVDAHLALKLLGSMKEKAGRSSYRHVWLYEVDGVQTLTVTRVSSAGE